MSDLASGGVLRGNAYVDLNKNYNLTNGSNHSAGGIWSGQSINLSKDINISFEFRLNNHTANEGFAFIFLSDNQRALGEPGAGLGIGGIDTSLAIEFDVRSNMDHDDQHSNGAEHMAVRLNGRFDPQANLSKNIPLKGIADGNFHQVKVHYNQMQKLLEVYLDGKKVLQLNYDMQNLVFHGMQEIYWGLTGTGAMGKSIITAKNFSVPMDVYLMFLQAERNGSDKIITWATSYETETENFELYRSNDGVVWGLAAVIPSSGPSSEVTVYNFVDHGYGDSDVVYMMRRISFTGGAEYIDVTNVPPDPDLITGGVIAQEDEKDVNDKTEEQHNFYDPVGRHIFYGTLSDFMKVCHPGLIYFSDNRQKYVKF